MYVAVKGGEQAIDNAHRLLAKKRRGDTATKSRRWFPTTSRPCANAPKAAT